MFSFINDDSGVVEPYVDLPSMALAVAGFVVFIALISQAHTAYQHKAFVAEHYQDAANIAEKLSKDSALTCSMRPDIIDTAKIEELKKDPKKLMQKYGGYYYFIFKVEAGSAGRTYSRVIKNPDIDESKIGVSASVPVTVRFNDVQEIPGTLTVKIWKK